MTYLTWESLRKETVHDAVSNEYIRIDSKFYNHLGKPMFTAVSYTCSHIIREWEENRYKLTDKQLDFQEKQMEELTIVKRAFNEACKRTAEYYQKKKDCGNDCPVYRNKGVCTHQCENPKFWETAIMDNVLNELDLKAKGNDTC